MITTSPWTSGHQVQEGDIILMPTIDRRKWPRFKAWLLGRPAPTKTERFKAGKVSGTSFDVTKS